MHTITFNIINEDNHNEYVGFEPIIGDNLSFNEPTFSSQLLFHDIFEHAFEESKYFSTKGKLTSNGESMAMGVRKWFYENTRLIEKYAGYNKNMGVDRNTSSILDSLVFTFMEDKEKGYYPKYPIVKKFKGLDLPKNDYKLALYDYGKEKYLKRMNKAYKYGISLADHLYEGMEEVLSSFMDNLILFMEKSGINHIGKEHYEVLEIPYLHGSTCGVEITKTMVTFVLNFTNGLEIYFDSEFDTDEIEALAKKVQDLKEPELELQS
jgi:hypothetical protein